MGDIRERQMFSLTRDDMWRPSRVAGRSIRLERDV